MNKIMDSININTVPPESIIFENEDLYICLAHHPLTPNHTIVAWKKKVEDLHELPKSDFVTLMNAVESTRDALLEAFSLEKVYLIYADEVEHVHWHLVPRYEEKGMTILNHVTSQISDFENTSLINKHLQL